MCRKCNFKKVSILDSRFEALKDISEQHLLLTVQLDILLLVLGKDSMPNGGESPVMGLEADMVNTIYEDKKLRKFTVCPFGGFDGWDAYRHSRTTR